MATRLKEREEKANELSASELEGEWLDVAEMCFNSLMDGRDKGLAERITSAQQKLLVRRGRRYNFPVFRWA